jgi:predicted acylesterase/phospholipase RssA
MSGTDRAHELGAFLAGIPFFASFDEDALVWLARQLEPVHAQAGDAIIAEGDPGDGLYVLLSGRLRVSVSTSATAPGAVHGGGVHGGAGQGGAGQDGAERVLHDLGRGAVIGEIALLSDRPRSATVRAVRDSDLLLLRTAARPCRGARARHEVAALRARPRAVPPRRHGPLASRTGRGRLPPRPRRPAEGHGGARLARMVTGTACGVVLGGGGSRGFAHLGVLHALETAGVPVDVIGGTSIGAVMGALYARGLSHAERVERALHAFTRSGPLVRPTLPLVALSSGNRVDRLLAEHFGRTLIENLPVRFFCVSANLTRAEEVIHERGELWRAVRASLSLPGIFPPVYADGDLLIDGGALDNVPAEVMRARVGGGTVVAVDISPAVEPMAVAPFGPGLSGWQVLADRINPRAPGQPVPTVFDIVSRATGLSGTRHQRLTLGGEHVDLLLHPPVPAIGVLDFRAGAALIETGFRHAAEALAGSALPGRFR